MRLQKKTEGIQEGDLTPMIDMTFQLIAFFMVLINFSQAEQNDKVKLPKSQLAKPPEAPIEHAITLHMDEEGQVYMGGQVAKTAEDIKPFLDIEASVLRLVNKNVQDATIIIRGHQNVPTGKVQELIRVCQSKEFEKFALRAEEDVGN